MFPLEARAEAEREEREDEEEREEDNMAFELDSKRRRRTTRKGERTSEQEKMKPPEGKTPLPHLAREPKQPTSGCTYTS